MLQVLKDIAANRMPSVADLLKQAAQAPLAMAKPTPKGPAVGQVKATGGKGSPSEVRPSKFPTPIVPQVVDRESQQQPPDKGEAPPGGKKNPSSPSLKLPVTTLGGAKPSKAPPKDAPPSSTRPSSSRRTSSPSSRRSPMSSTRCSPTSKAAPWSSGSRPPPGRNTRSPGGSTTASATASASLEPEVKPEAAKVLAEMAAQEAKGGEVLSNIMDDLDAYFERRRFMKFKAVLDDMRKQDVLGGLRQLSDDLKRENGVSIAQCEFWSDAMDRWAEDLVDPSKSGVVPRRQVEGQPPAFDRPGSPA